MIRGKYVEYNLGNNHLSSIVDSLHSTPPGNDMYTGKIVRLLINKIDTSSIISLISRLEMDLNRPINDQNRLGILEYRHSLREILNSKGIIDHHNRLTKRFLHISVHGMKNRGTDFEIGTIYGESCSRDIKDWFCDKLKIVSPNIGIDNRFSGDSSKSYHRNGDPENDYLGYGENFNTIQFEIGYNWRTKKINEVVNFLCDIVLHFDLEFNI